MQKVNYFNFDIILISDSLHRLVWLIGNYHSCPPVSVLAHDNKVFVLVLSPPGPVIFVF